MAGSGGLAESGRAPPDASCDAIRARKTMTSHWRADTTPDLPAPRGVLRVAQVVRGAPAWTTRAASVALAASLSGELDGAAALADHAHLVLVAGKVARDLVGGLPRQGVRLRVGGHVHIGRSEERRVGKECRCE